MSEPDYKDLQISPRPFVKRTALHEFSVTDLLRRPYAYGNHATHTLHAVCEYCHKELTVKLHAPWNIPKFVIDEACRVAILEHLRTEHVKSNFVSEDSNLKSI
jgi:hypothetical protein